MKDKQKQWLAWGIVALALTLVSVLLGVKYPIPEPPPFLPDDIVLLGTTHFTNISAEDITATDDLTVTDDASVGGDFTVTGDTTVTGNILGNTNIISKTTSYTLLTTESGSTATNLGASAGLTFTLPTAAVGLRYCFYVGAGQIITVSPGSSDYILHLTNAADNRINNAATAGDSVCLTAIDVTHWIPNGEVGTWSDTN